MTSDPCGPERAGKWQRRGMAGETRRSRCAGAETLNFTGCTDSIPKWKN